MTGLAVNQETGLGPNSIEGLFEPLAQYIAGVRLARQLPPLTPDGNLLFGQEEVPTNSSPPRIVIVPTGTRYEAARAMGANRNVGTLDNSNPKPYWLRWLQFEAQLWGDDDSSVGRLYGYDSTLELERELLSGLAITQGNTPNVVLGRGRWVQPRDMARNGRLLVVPFEIGTAITGEPFLVYPFSQTPGDGGVTVNATVQAIDPATGDATTVDTFTVP